MNDSIADLLLAIDEQGWKVTRSTHGRDRCTGCLYAALNGMSLARADQDTATGYTSAGHEAMVMRKKAR